MSDPMHDGNLHTIRDMARELSLPESTVRYYRDVFSHHLPSVGVGPRRLYPAAALHVLSVVASGYAAGKKRHNIENELTSLAAGAEPESPSTAMALAKYDDLLSTILEGERERRDALFQVASEIVRLGEALERQQVMLGTIAERVGGGAESALVENETEKNDDGIPIAEAEPIDSAVEAEINRLRMQLDEERELVDRLRRSKIEMERRAAEAEAQLDTEANGDRHRSQRSRLARLLLGREAHDP